jgi:hypothetical protein
MPKFRAVVAKEFKAIQQEFADYESALPAAYPLPVVPDP